MAWRSASVDQPGFASHGVEEPRDVLRRPHVRLTLGSRDVALVASEGEEEFRLHRQDIDTLMDVVADLRVVGGDALPIVGHQQARPPRLGRARSLGLHPLEGAVGLAESHGLEPQHAGPGEGSRGGLVLQFGDGRARRADCLHQSQAELAADQLLLRERVEILVDLTRAEHAAWAMNHGSGRLRRYHVGHVRTAAVRLRFEPSVRRSTDKYL